MNGKKAKALRRTAREMAPSREVPAGVSRPQWPSERERDQQRKVYKELKKVTVRMAREQAQ